MRIVDTNLKPISRLQQRIMRFIDNWARTKKTPIPYKVVMKHMKDQGVKSYTIINALNGLLKKGYIRRAVTGVGFSNRTYYVQLRGV